MTFGKSLKLCTGVKHPKNWKWSPKPSVMLNSKPFCKRIQRHFAAILAVLQRNSENRNTSKRILLQIMSTFIWIFVEDYRCRSQNEVQSVYWSPTQVTIYPVVMYYETQNSEETFTKALCLFRMSPDMIQYLSTH